ncbi:MAG: RagB/SusD family nutrient uptake outer membrane protein [Reichenbachiella sp.]|uniref:RagB/SusD family nutrient uptake outer membrane protein n=1 Tax=Reichenbachiella sp. TaxID=2184521 RepID=UPI003262D443
MKRINQYILAIVAVFTLSCELDEPVDLNNPSFGGVLNDASIGQLNELVTGIVARASTGMGNYHDIVGVIGREIYRIDVSDPRWVGDLLGTGNLDNSAFYTGTNFSTRYNGVKTANTLISAVENTSVLTNAEAQGYLAFAKTFKAHALLFALNHQYDNGIRIDVEDPNALGAFTSNAAEGYDAIGDLLDEAAGHAANAGNSFAFGLTTGFDGFDTPATFETFIKALQARVALYQEDYASAATFVDQSFINESGSFDVGVYRVFANASGDRVNALFFPNNTNGTTRLVQNDWVTDAEAGDLRLSKASLRTSPATVITGQLFASYDAWNVKDQVQPMAFIRNEELILIKAEALIQEGSAASLAEAVILIDVIRTQAGGLPAYAGAVTQSALIDEMLTQRRYSLFDEGHRWIDMRRYDRLDQLPLDLTNHSVIRELPRPFNEVGVQGG